MVKELRCDKTALLLLQFFFKKEVTGANMAGDCMRTAAKKSR
jgi:hypothetical protein